jgi:hypothetical protein
VGLEAGNSCGSAVDHVHIQRYAVPVGKATLNRRMRHSNAALGHHRHEISIAQPIGDVPTNAPRES